MKTKNPGKQRKRIYDSSMHQVRKRLVAPLDKAIIQSVGKKRLAIRKGDTVKVAVGDNKGKTSKVERVDYTKGVVYLKDFKVVVRGRDKLIPFIASNLVLTNVVLDDSKRIKGKAKKK